MAAGAAEVAGPSVESMATLIAGQSPAPEPVAPAGEPAQASTAETQVAADAVGAETRIAMPAVAAGSTVLAAPPLDEQAEVLAAEGAPAIRKGSRLWPAALGGLLLLVILGVVVFAVVLPTLRQAARQGPTAAVVPTIPVPTATPPAANGEGRLTAVQVAQTAVAEHPDDGSVTLDSSGIKEFLAPNELVKTIRASILVLGT